MMDELTEAFEKCNTTAGKLSEACRLVEKLKAEIDADRNIISRQAEEIERLTRERDEARKNCIDSLNTAASQMYGLEIKLKNAKEVNRRLKQLYKGDAK